MVRARHSVERYLYRRYRDLKGHIFTRPDRAFSKLVSRAIRLMDVILSPRRVAPKRQAEDRVWKAIYLLRFPSPPVRIETAQPIAMQSADHKWPRGTIYDNSLNRRFNLKAYDYFRQKPELRLLDLGCAGGGLVRSFIEDGHFAVGVEGSDASRRLRSGEWDNVPYHLFTADISEPFCVLDSRGEPLAFDIITAWDVLEHIPEEKLSGLIENIRRHLAPGGMFVSSIDMLPDGDLVTGAIYHVTLRPKSWWVERFAAAGLIEKSDHPFGVQDFVRGHGQGLRDWDPADGNAFHLVACHRAAHN